VKRDSEGVGNAYRVSVILIPVTCPCCPLSPPPLPAPSPPQPPQVREATLGVAWTCNPAPLLACVRCFLHPQTALPWVRNLGLCVCMPVRACSAFLCILGAGVSCFSRRTLRRRPSNSLGLGRRR
jgi:hypothetical protein